MSKSTRLLLSLALTAALATPSLADAQAIPRPVGGGSSSGAASGGSSGGSSGGGGSTSSGGGSSSRVGGGDTRSRAPSRIPSAGATRRGTAVSRSGGERPSPVAPGGVVSGGSSNVSARTGANRAATDSTGNAIGRDRADRPVTGFAAVRPTTEPPKFIAFPLYGPWGRWYPWYGSGFGYGFVTYNPWYYGATPWYFGRYGMWYDPYGYHPYYYDDWYYGGRYSRDEDREERRFGSIRIKADPKTAKVYIDGALVGVVDDFDGLTNHLELEAGAHQLELRADGYEPYVADVTVDAGKVRTERIKLKKVK